MPNNLTFKADTLEKAIVKLHRLNAAQHNSIDDWHLNMMEATKDLQDEQAQEDFIKYQQLKTSWYVTICLISGPLTPIGPSRDHYYNIYTYISMV